jgi:predicted metal-dependent phosphotriesterase family hydrolase
MTAMDCTGEADCVCPAHRVVQAALADQGVELDQVSTRHLGGQLREAQEVMLELKRQGVFIVRDGAGELKFCAELAGGEVAGSMEVMH